MRAFVCLMVLVLATSAFAADNLLKIRSKDAEFTAPPATVYLKTDSLRRAGNYITAEFVTSYDQPRYNEAHKFYWHSEVYIFAFDCEVGEYAMLGFTGFTGPLGTGSIASALTLPGLYWKSGPVSVRKAEFGRPPSGSFAESDTKLVCGLVPFMK
ncbi:surface-adhesin E family protein [Undibacterium sp. Ji42W]|uniref:surface-adhesin E family protein n=1 Tax=Undibacterium sp. Ji42W TaxID=3413039 RepID=UPI003BF187C2